MGKAWPGNDKARAGNGKAVTTETGECFGASGAQGRYMPPLTWIVWPVR
jgi:hypothetical protein